MSNTYAVLDANNKAVNFILWDGVSEYVPFEGAQLIPLPEGISYNFGWLWDGEKFIDPNPPVIEEPIVP